MEGCTGKLKRRIKSGDTLLFGCVMDCRSGSAVEMYHELGYDAIMIDREHTALNDETVLEHIRLARALGIPVMVRVAEPDYSQLNKIMDQAPDGIYVPRIRSRADVENVVSMISFPPEGVKGYGASTCPAGRYIGWPTSTDQVKFYSKKFVLGIQIETREARENLDDILSVPGIDVAVIGNDDLSLGLGIPGQFDHPEYLRAVRDMIDACHRHGVLPGIAGGDPAWVKKWHSEGMRVFWTATDVVSMWLWSKQTIESLHDVLKGQTK